MKIERCPVCRCAPPCRCITTARRTAVEEPARGIEPRPSGLRPDVDTANSAGLVAEATTLHQVLACAGCAERDANIADLEARLAKARTHIIELDIEATTLRDEIRRMERAARAKGQPVTTAATQAATLCVVCDEPLPPPTYQGPPRSYCSTKCRMRAHRAR